MGANGVAGCVDERGLRGLEGPLWAGGGLPAGVDLNAFAGDGEDGLLGGWRVRGILSDCNGRKSKRRGEDQGEKVSLPHWEEFYASALRVCVNETECADLPVVGGYWNDDD